jgi:SAM-dependent methyltransferase
MNPLALIHSRYVHRRRARVLVDHLAPLFPPGAKVLDVGCGDGLLSCALSLRRPDLAIEGVEVRLREQAFIEVKPFDGRRLPAPDGRYDAVLLVDVVHHAAEPIELLREAAHGFLALPTLRWMDWVGNARHGVPLPYKYWPEHLWREAFDGLGLRISSWERDLGLYPRAVDWLFGRSLHFIARLEKSG